MIERMSIPDGTWYTVVTRREPFARNDPGRTMREAINDGTLFRLSVGGRDVGEFPGARTIGQALWCSAKRGSIRTGDVVTVQRHLPQSEIGCAWLEHVGNVIVEVVP